MRSHLDFCRPLTLCALVLQFLTLSAPGAPAASTTRISLGIGGVEANGASTWPVISGDGRHVAFASAATNLVAGDTNERTDVFVFDRATGTTTRESLSSSGTQANGNSETPAISADGRYVAFASRSSNLAATSTNYSSQIYLRDRQAGTTVLVSALPSGVACSGYAYSPAISADGSTVAFASAAVDLVPGDTNGATDVFVRRIATSTTSRVSVGTGGLQGEMPASCYDSTHASLSADGRYVAYSTCLSGLVAGDSNGIGDVFLHDAQTGATTRVSESPVGVSGDASSEWPVISGDGRFVAYNTWARNIVTRGG